ncbi:MAG TPA: prephenate dehydrogenase/arogenate dehydrogenase family protein [Leucothrix mucor]|uniref:prephenate dehydrogenase n=1 Tax=Leucothrix mucor TaxID=45248 RepID=A0A7V2T0Y2_LEUMU|nr:prephenate dehydrogenase/arogenate dehydrogenase family protein [Leucothrix mucor]
MIKQLTIFGVGLIGGSLALALKKAGYCQQVVGCSRSADHLQRAVDLGVIDRYTLNPAEAVKGADMILVAVPMGAMQAVFASIADHLEEYAVMTDAGSAKGSVIAAAKAAFGEIPAQFVPGHPIAGREKSSVEAALDDLYTDHKVILTPLENTNPDAIQRVTKMWQTAGAEVENLEVDQHDLVLAATSHLPHILAFSFVNTLAESEHCDKIFHYVAGGFKDFSRIASSDPVMWRDICLENKGAILNALDNYQQNLSDLAELIKNEESDALLNEFESAKTERDKHI